MKRQKRIPQIPQFEGFLRDAKRLNKLPEPERAFELYKMQQQVTASAVEFICTEIAQMADVPDDVRHRILNHLSDVKIGDAQVSDRASVRKIEAILLAAGVTEVPTAKAVEIYDAKHGVDVFVDKERGVIVIEEQRQKWMFV